MGLAHGVYCLGCCGLLMALLFTGGLMDPFWIGVFAVYVLVERLAPEGPWLSVASGLMMAGIGSSCWPQSLEA
jgi:predicted metal-binding membrane protein